VTASLVPWLLGALLLFWSLGAHNRMVRLRAGVLGQFALVDQHMLQALGLLGDAARVCEGHGVAPQPGASTPVPSEAHDALLAAAGQFEVALRVTRKSPLDAGLVAALRSAHATVHDAWERHHAGRVHAPVSPDGPALQRAWEGNTEVVREAVLAFNGAVQAYNAAIAQFPASMLAYLFSFKRAARL